MYPPEPLRVNSYECAGLVVASPFDFPDLYPASGDKYHISVVAGGIGNSRGAEAFHSWLDSRGLEWLTFSRTPFGYLLSFAAGVDFAISSDGSKVQILDSAAPARTVRHLFVDQVLPLVLSLHGRVVVHASVVATDLGAVAFLGSSGSGKSTLAAFLGRNHKLISDDCVELLDVGGKLSVSPISRPISRLWPESASALGLSATSSGRVSHYNSKERYETLGPSGTMPLKLLILIPEANRESSPATLSHASPRELFFQLLRYNFQVDPESRTLAISQMRRLACLSRLTSSFWLTYTREYASLAAVENVIAAKLSGA